MEVRCQRREVPTVGFFDGASHDPSMRGHNALPRKSLAWELCHHGLTSRLDEYRTSKMCPCGQDKLKTSGRFFGHHVSNSENGEMNVERDPTLINAFCLKPVYTTTSFPAVIPMIASTICVREECKKRCDIVLCIKDVRIAGTPHARRRAPASALTKGTVRHALF